MNVPPVLTLVVTIGRPSPFSLLSAHVRISAPHRVAILIWPGVAFILCAP